ncbi:MAG: hypothetical protein JNL83_06565, partial [Myxococcales bacterium]|nr:hypothetical protein [Myxococcales bacterium]
MSIIPTTPVPDTGRSRRYKIAAPPPASPRIAKPAPPPKLRMRLRSKLVVAMAFAGLVPVLIVAVLATRVILSSLESGLRDDARRQLTVGLNLVLRAVERIGDETVQMSESTELSAAIDLGPPALEAWIAHEGVHVPSARLQILDANGTLIFDRVLGGATARFADVGVDAQDAMVTAAMSWTRAVSRVAIGDKVVVRAVSPIVDSTLALKGVLVLSTPLDGDFADGIKGALAADVLLGGLSGKLAVTFRSTLGRRADPFVMVPEDRRTALEGKKVVRDIELPTGTYEIATTALLDSQDRP